MTSKSHFWIVPVFLYCQPVIIWAQTDPNGWENLNLNSTTIAGAKVYYEKSFEPNLPYFEKMYKQLLFEKNIINIVISQKDSILADINKILGIEDVNNVSQNRAFSKGLDTFSSLEIQPLYLVKKRTIKDFLRTGEQLPHFTYDKTRDYVEYKPNIEFTSEDQNPRNLEFVFLIESIETFEKDIGENLKPLQLMLGDISSGTAIHEFVELSLFLRASPTDPYWRWFSEGFANAITINILEKYVGPDSADSFLKSYNVNDYKDIEKEINLRYWMIANYCILSNDMPTEKGQKFNLARYAYATFEARRLIDKHGIDCVREILDKITAKQSRTGSDLIETIKNVTSEDMDARLDAYQSFSNVKEGRKKYITAFKKLSEKQDYEQMLFNLLRGNELLFSLPVDYKEYLREHSYAANCLLKMGYEQEADTIMTNIIDVFSKPNMKNGREVGLEAFAIYAIESGKPVKAQKFAEELLKTKPDNLTALTIQMLVCIEDKQFSQAKELAKKILGLSKNEKSIPNQIAVHVLAIDPNQPESEK